VNTLSDSLLALNQLVIAARGFHGIQRRAAKWKPGPTIKTVTGTEAILSHEMLEIGMKDRTFGHMYTLCKKPDCGPKEEIFSARMIDSWNELDAETATIDLGDKFKRKLGE